MDSEAFADFCRAIGHRVIRTPSAYWYDVLPRVFQAFPFHLEIRPDEEEIARLLGVGRAWVLRMTVPPEAGRQSYLIACRGADYDLSRLGQKARNQTRRGLEQCEVRRVSFDELAEQGMDLNRDTLERQGRRIPKNFYDYWHAYFSAAARCPIAEAWGAFIGGALAAYLIAFTMEGCVNILIVRSRSALLKHYPNNALVFSFTREALRRPGVRLVSFGLESLQAGLESLDHFKLGMGYEPIPTGQRLEVAPFLMPVIREPLRSVVERMVSRVPNENMRKLAGLLRWLGEAH